MLIIRQKTVQNILWILNTLSIMYYYILPLTGGKIIEKHKRRGKLLRYNLSSLRDSLVAKVLPDTNDYLSDISSKFRP